MTPDERAELLAAYALGTLPEPEAAEVRELVRRDSATAAELAGYHEIVDLIALSVPLRRGASSTRPALRRMLPWAGVAAAVLLVAVWGVNLRRDLSELRSHSAALTAIVEADASASTR
ncbi:MAG: hypothetical protein EXR65_00890 [Dehalococcoidia bacterium]|nr:hypothetical protein [Dehalococcoidia bacterium]